jgi:hypothetical protein
MTAAPGIPAAMAKLRDVVSMGMIVQRIGGYDHASDA